MMHKGCFRSICVLLLSLLVGLFTPAGAEELSDNTPSKPLKRPLFFGLKGMGGVVLPTNDYIMQGNKFPPYMSGDFRFGVESAGDRWEDVVYGMPYYGIGLYAAKFYEKDALGSPISLYLFQGKNITTIGRRSALRYELNAGISFNWKAYDRFDNPENIVLGSGANAHIGANIHFHTRLSRHWALNLGVGVNHFSNGAYQLPNYGLNAASGFAELTYTPNPPTKEEVLKSRMTAPVFKRRFDFDIQLINSSRQIRVDTLNTGMPLDYFDRNFKVFGLSGAALFVPNYKYKWGPAIDISYDESGGVEIWRERHPDDGKYYDRIKYGSFYEQISVGVGLRGEVVFPYVNLFANMGYVVLQGTDRNRFYQILGIKLYLIDNVFGTFGIRANRFSKAQYIFWSLGITLKKERPNRRIKDVF